MRTKITLACSECKQRNYDNMKNKKNNPDRLEMKILQILPQTHCPQGNKIRSVVYA